MSNRLAYETSPYLLQHAHNPVDWYPWGPEALERARREDRPILLSVGYSACHWCHVMERESFEDAAVAAEMNRHFVCVKVDREERPDLDEIYMRAVQAFTGGHGGWPMTVFLTPEGRPFFGGTYFPPAPRHGMPSFRQVLEHAHRMYRERKDQVAEVGGELVEYLDASGRMPAPADALTDRWLDAVATACDEEFDAREAGFGGAPKFPPHGALAGLLAHWRRTGSRRSLKMATATLDAMAKGGMYDVLGGGFARYSVDEQWLIPHFEKMLYDNAQLLPIYADAYRVTGDARYARICRETVGWLSREMTSPEGAFFSALDADSEGEEGRYYVWTPRQIRDVVGLFDGARAATLLGVTDQGNFEHGTSALRLDTPLEALDEADRALLADAMPRLLAARASRVPPGRDDKVLTSWNALMISALARAGAALGEGTWVVSAARAARYLLGPMTVAGRLQRTAKGGKVHIPAFADDHAFLVAALVDLYEVTFEAHWLEAALGVAEQLVALFWDEEEGGFFYTGADSEPLVTRSKHMLGGAEPSANGVAALAFQRLGVLTGRQDLEDRAERVLRSYQPLLDRAPRGLGLEAIAGAWATGATMEVGVVGAADDPRTIALLAEVRRRYLPFAVVARVDPGDEPALLPWMAGRTPADGAPTAYLCERGACQLPTRDPDELGRQLDEAVTPERPRDSWAGRDHAPALPADPAAWLNTDAGLSIEGLRGNVVVLDFWTYCCINCMHVLPELAAIEARYAGQPVAVVGVHASKFPAEREPARVQAALRRHGVRHPVVMDAAHKLWQAYAVHAWPTVLVLDTTGRIAWRQSGEASREQLADVIERLLAEGREDGTLGAPVWSAPARSASDGGLAWPGKVHVWPDAPGQAMGADPFGAEARLYVSDTGHHRMLECKLSLGHDGWPRARRLRVFGTGEPGLVDGPMGRGRLSGPQGMARSRDTLWVADTGNHALRAIDLPSGELRTEAGNGELGRGPSAGIPTRTPLRSPWDVAVSPGEGDQGAVLIAMAGAHQIWVYLPTHKHLGPFIGSGREDHVDGPAAEAALAQPSGLVIFGRYLFLADAETSSIRAFDLAERTVGTLVGRGLFDFGDIDGKGAAVRLQHPLDVAVADAVAYVADTFNNKIKAIDLNGAATTTLAGGAPELLSEPGGLAVAGEFLIVADTNNHRLRVLRRQTGELRDLPLEV